MFRQFGYYICWPFAWLTRQIYLLTGSYALAILLFTVIVKLILLPFQLKSKKSMLRMNRMQGKLKDIQTRYANNKQKQQEEMAELYAREGINPMSGCLWSFIPFPIIIALYYIIRMPMKYFMNMGEEAINGVRTLAETLGFTAGGTQQAAYEQIYLAKFAHEHWADFAGKFEHLIDLDYNFIGIDLASTPSSLFDQFPHGGWAMWGLFALPIIATIAQFAMTIVSMKANGNSSMQGTGKTMMYMMPLMTLWMGFILPGALSIYWAAQAAFSVVQELTLNKYFNKIIDREETDKEREKREKRYAKMQAARANYDQKMAEAQGNKSTATSKKKQQAQKEAEKAEKKPGTNENGRLGNRPYARGRAYSEDHYGE